MRTIGIDEAGRGPIIGPLTIAGVSIDETVADMFKKAGVKDSKMLSRRRIFLLERLVKKESDNLVLVIEPKRIDERFHDGKNLNYLELDHMCEIANSLTGERVIVDSPSANTKKIRDYLIKRIPKKEIIAENYADRDYIEVSAASILAKAERERQVELIKKEIGYDFGSGYSSDPKTKAFLSLIKSNGKLNSDEYSKYLRKSWFTFKNMNLKTLKDYD